MAFGLALLAGLALAQETAPAATEPVGSPRHEIRALDIDADELVRRAEDALRGDTAQMKATMTITTTRWTRELSFRSWDDRHHDRSLTRIPPSMMLQPWMGSDFTNDDLARESSMVEDYSARVLGERDIDGTRAWGVELIPNEDAPVVWSKIEAWVVAERFAPLLYLYYDEPERGRFELVRRMRFSDVRDIAGRPVPHYWVIEPLDKPGNSTAIRLDEFVLDEPLDDSLFTQDNLKRAEAVR